MMSVAVNSSCGGWQNEIRSAGRGNGTIRKIEFCGRK